MCFHDFSMFSEVAICTVDICQFFSALTMTLRNDPLLQERGRAQAIMCVAIAVVLVGPVVCCDSDRVAVAYRTVKFWCFYFVVLVVFPSCPFLTFLCVRLDWSFAYGTLAGHVLFAVLFHGISRLKILVDPRDTPAVRPGFSICLPAVFRNFSDPPKGGTSQLQLRNALAACPACPGTLEWVHKLADDRRRTWVLKPKCSQVSVWMPIDVEI